MAYLIKCECGQNLVVEGADAGTSRACRCGRTLDVPSLSELRNLPRGQSHTASPQEFAERQLDARYTPEAVEKQLVQQGVEVAAAREAVQRKQTERRESNVQRRWYFWTSGLAFGCGLIAFVLTTKLGGFGFYFAGGAFLIGMAALARGLSLGSRTTSR